MFTRVVLLILNNVITNQSYLNYLNQRCDVKPLVEICDYSLQPAKRKKCAPYIIECIIIKTKIKVAFGIHNYAQIENVK